MSGDFEIRSLTGAHDEARDAYVAEHEDGTLFHESVWRRVVHEVLDARSRELAAFRGDELVGVLPIMKVRRLPFGCNWVSMPYGVYGGPLADSPEVSRALLEEAGRAARADGVKRVELRTVEVAPGAEDWALSELYSTFVKDLPDTPEGVLAGMPKKARAEARKARDKHGLALAEGNWYVEDLYRLFVENKRALGSPALPAQLFRRLLDRLGDRCFVHLVHRARTPISAVMSFAHGDTLIAYYSGTAPGADRELSASNFMYMALQEWAVERGFRRFDFCRSRGDSGAYRFKVHQGFTPTQLHYSYLLVGTDKLPQFTPSNPRTRVLRDAWSKLPRPLVEKMSPFLSRYLA
ncbi:MAG: FemAB family PEP-CTERM system-associated protein [Planctomycetota bacterium]